MTPSEAAGAGVPALSVRLVAEAASRGLRIAVAESLTGGLLADALVSVPGASQVFSGGIVAYDTALKRSLLGVEAELLAARGPVDPEVARQMASGVRRACAVPADGGAMRPSDIGIATTGVAGPDPDPQSGQPAGTVWIGLSHGAQTRALRLSLDGDRAAIRAATVHEAVRLLAETVDRIPET